MKKIHNRGRRDPLQGNLNVLLLYIYIYIYIYMSLYMTDKMHFEMSKDTVHDTHALRVTICSHSTDEALHIFYADTVNQTCNF